MGTQSYDIAAKKYTKTKPRFLKFMRENGPGCTASMEEFAEGSSGFWEEKDVDFPRFSEEYSCRELILEDLRVLADLYCKEDSIVLAIRMGGEQHNDVSKLMQGKDNVKLVQDLLSRTLLLKGFELKSGKFSNPVSKTSWRPFGDSSVTSGSKKKGIPYYVDLYIDGDSLEDYTFFIKLSALIALLREPRIIGGIIKGKINGPHAVIEELLKISEDRQQEKDTSYMCWKLCSSDSDGILRELRFPGNEDASDGYSIAVLALFIVSIQEELNIYSWECSGPVDLMENDIDLYLLAEKLIKLNIDISGIKGGLMETLYSIIEEKNEEAE